MARRKSGFTLIELLVVVSIIAMLMSILLPSLNQARETARGISCTSNARQCIMGMLMFTHENDQYLPPVGHTAAWRSIGRTQWWFYDRYLGPYLGSHDDKVAFPKVINCPNVKQYGIGYNHPQIGRWIGPTTRDEFEHRLGDIPHPADTVAFADAANVGNIGEPDESQWKPVDPEQGAVLFRTPDNMPFFDTMPDRPINRHNNALSAGFMDGHAELVNITELGFDLPLRDPGAKWDRY